MQKAILDQIENLIEEGSKISENWEISRWAGKVTVFLNTTLGSEIANDFSSLDSGNEWDALAMKLGLLQGIAAKAQDGSVKQLTTDQTSDSRQKTIALIEVMGTPKIFIVHGHDEAAKDSTARYLEKLNLQPIILHEQASGGRTIIEKFEKYSGDVGFAVVLLTPDDIGNTKTEPMKLLPRARQNVILELGYFLSKLNRNRVCALYKEGVELPSDIQGIIYVEMDNKGAWKAKLAQELVEAKYPINLAGLVNG